jgi:hypothetical protein
LTTGPVFGFAVRDLPTVVDERAPDGNVYELVTS